MGKSAWNNRRNARRWTLHAALALATIAIYFTAAFFTTWFAFLALVVLPPLAALSLGPPPIDLPRAVALAVAGGLALVVASEYVNPQPLARVQLVTESSVKFGRLVTVTDGGVVLSTAPDTLQVLRGDTVEAVHVRTPKRRGGIPSLYEVLTVT